MGPVRWALRHPVRFWVAFWVGFALFDRWCAVNDIEGDSLSEATRALFHTEHPAGRAVLYVGWGALTSWLLPHLSKQPNHRDLPPALGHEPGAGGSSIPGAS